MTNENPSVGDYETQRDGSYRLFVGGNRGWILCDDHSELLEELSLLNREGNVEESKEKESC